jgi:hypothetical protein
MVIITFNGLLFSPLVLFLTIAVALTIITNLTVGRILYRYTNLTISWLNLSFFICYFATSVLILGD